MPIYTLDLTAEQAALLKSLGDALATLKLYVEESAPAPDPVPDPDPVPEPEPEPDPIPAPPVIGATYPVNPGENIVAALAKCSAGDRVQLRDGDHGGKLDIKGFKVGTKEKPVRIETMDIHDANLREVEMENCAGLLIAGLRTNRGSHGFRVVRSRDITLEDVWAYGANSSGISVWGTPWTVDPAVDGWAGTAGFTARRFKVQRCVDGGWNEQITIANGVLDVLLEDFELWESGDVSHGGEGLDIKCGVRGARVLNGHIHDIKKMAAYVDGGLGIKGNYTKRVDCENIVFDGLLIEDINSSGIQVSTEGAGWVRNFTAINNTVRRCSKHSLLAYIHPEAGNRAFNKIAGNLDGIWFRGSKGDGNLRLAASGAKIGFSNNAQKLVVAQPYTQLVA